MIKFIVVLLALATSIVAETVPEGDSSWQYGYIEKYGIPAAERIRKAEEEILSNGARIVGGRPSTPGQFPYHAGIISDLVGTTSRGVCGGSLISTTRVLTGAHCWFDGQIQAWRFTIVLGSNFLFSGGTRIQTSRIVLHDNWDFFTGRNDIAVVFLPNAVATSANIGTIALPTGALVNANLVGTQAIVPGFGITRDGATIGSGQSLHHVTLRIISNDECRNTFLGAVQPTNICTSGANGVGPCRGDLGGALVITSNNRPVQVGIASFISRIGCERGFPAAYTRIDRFLDFINRHL